MLVSGVDACVHTISMSDTLQQRDGSTSNDQVEREVGTLEDIYCEVDMSFWYGMVMKVRNSFIMIIQ